MKQALRVNRSMHGLSDDPSVPGVIGPNAVLQLMEALKVAGLGDLSAPIFATAGVAGRRTSEMLLGSAAKEAWSTATN